MFEKLRQLLSSSGTAHKIVRAVANLTGPTDVHVGDCVVRAKPAGVRNLPWPEETPDDQLSVHITRLMMLHQDKFRFDFSLLALMSDETKRSLIQDLNKVLGIKDLCSRGSNG